MRHHPRSALILSLGLILATQAAPTHAASSRTCLVTHVVDGDTLKARCGTRGHHHVVRVRLAAIDAPELRQRHGPQARQALSRLALHQTARLDCLYADRYGRQVCTVWVAPGSRADSARTLDVGHALLTTGQAWWYRAASGQQSPQARGQYEFAEREARARRVGLWSGRQPQPPWEWRQRHATSYRARPSGK